MNPKVLLLWLLTLFFWGATPLFEKIALRAADPLVALTVRTGLAALLLAGATIATGKVPFLFSLTIKDYAALGLSGLFAGVLGMFTYFSLLKSGEASKVVPLTAAYPLVTALCASLFLEEKITFLRLLGILLTILGLTILQRS